MHRSRSIRCCAVVAALAAAAILSSPGHAQQRRIDQLLVDAGFVMRPADTPQKLQRLRALPSHRFAARTTNGQRYYIYADPTDCKCALVGYQKAYDAYRDMIKPPTPPPGEREFANELPRVNSTVMPEMLHEMDDDAGIIDSDDILGLPF